MIHNPARTDRFELLLLELGGQGLLPITTLVPSVEETRNPIRNISRAHKNCVRMAKEDGAPFVIILEDDVHFMCHESFVRFVELSQELPPDWDIFLSGVYDAKFEPFSDTIKKVTKFSGLHCYMVNARYYDTFLSANEIINLDKWMSTTGHGSSNAYVAYPMLAMQHDGFSDNVKRVTEYNKQVKTRFQFWDCSK